MTTVDYDAVVVGAGCGRYLRCSQADPGGVAGHRIRGCARSGWGLVSQSLSGSARRHRKLLLLLPGRRSLSTVHWKERYPAQPEILAYLNFAADTGEVRPYIRFSTWVTGAQWEPDANRYRVTASSGESVTARYLIMASGQLSKAADPAFAGLEDFRGRWVQTSHWPTDHVDTAGKRIAVIGTGSSGVQVVPALARDAENVTVFHRTANYSVPAQNGPLDQQKYSDYAKPSRRAAGEDPAPSGRLGHTTGCRSGEPSHRTSSRRYCGKRWARGGHTMNAVFTDQGTDIHANTIVADFVRAARAGYRA